MSAEQAQDSSGRRKRHPVRILAGVLVLVLVLFLVGLVRFASSVAETAENTPPPVSDGIVVFTGGTARVAVAIALLADGRAQRLLISGVNPKSTAGAIADGSVGSRELFNCCVDLDRESANTIGNARETARWSQEHEFESLIVVTSSYHMPRSLLELRHVLPETRLQPYPVTVTRLQLEQWWQRPQTVQLLMSEYVKYLTAWARHQISDSAGSSDLTAVSKADG